MASPCCVLGKMPRGASSGPAFFPTSESEPGGGGGEKSQKTALVSTCNFTWYVTAEAIIVFVKLKSERR